MKDHSKINVLHTALALLLALGISFAIILLVSSQPLEAIGKMIFGPLKSRRVFGNVIELAIPLMFTGVSVCLMFSARQINLASEGAFHLGGLTAAAVALSLPLPPPLLSVVAILLGGAAGSLVTFTPALLKVKSGASEIVTSLMMNYLVLFFANFVLAYFLFDPSGALVSSPIPAAARLTRIVPGTGVHSGLLVALVVVLLAHLFLQNTRTGYALRVTGENDEFARYVGMNVTKIVLISQLLGGLVAGMGGAVQLLGVFRRFSWVTLLGYGWDAIIIATLARNQPKNVPLAAFFLAYIRIGADIMSRNTDVPANVVSITQGIIIVLVAAKQFLAGYRFRQVVQSVTQKQESQSENSSLQLD